MKIIDLLVKIANNEEVPNKIKIGNDIYWFDINDSQYTRFTNNDLGKPFGLLEDMNLHNAYVWFNLDVEIIEDKPKKIENMGLFDLTIKDEENELGYTGVADTIETVYCKLDEIIDSVNYLLEKSDKE